MSSSLTPDLEKVAPRSPADRMNGLVWIPRLIDKARAARANQLGEYLYPCPLDRILLEFLKMDGETFADQVVDREDSDLETWLMDRLKQTSEAERQKVNQAILQRQPDSPEKWDKFHKIRNTLAPERTDITTWAALIDLEEGRA